MLTTIDKPSKPKLKAVAPQGEKMERIIITPEIAAAWLDKNRHNRKAKPTHVAKLARDMAAGRFEFTGDPIRFSAAGDLIDGQHRLLACVKANVPFESLVIYGMAPHIQDKLDSGKPRLANDVLTLHGFHNATHLVGAARLLMGERDNVNSRRAPYTTGDIADCLSKHPMLASVVRDVRLKKLPKGISFSHVACVCYVGAHILGRQTAAAAFLDVMRTGIPSYEGDAAHAYRERILRAGGGTIMLKHEEKWRLMKHAWNLFLANEPAKILRGSADVGFDKLDIKSL